MKKNIATYRLNRDTSARQALFKNLMISLVQQEEIETTKAKAAAVRGLFERLITTAKKGTVAARRQVQATLQNSVLVKKLVDDIAVRYAEVKGGYTKVVPVGNRRGDGAAIVRLGLTKKQAPQKSATKAETKATTKAEVKKTPVAKLAVPKKETATVAKVVAPRTGRRGDR